MAEIITMPRLSDTMTDGKVAKWHKNVGDKVSEGDLIAEIETDKAVQDFESEFDGVLLHQGVQEGGSAPVDAILAVIGEQGEDISGILDGNSGANPGGNTEENLDEGAAPEPEKSIDLKNEGVREDFKTGADTPVENSEPVESDEAQTGEMPDNVEVINMPRLSDTMTEGKVAKWHKNVGDKVKEGDLLAEIETDKAVQDFESEFDGVLLHQGVAEGEQTAVDNILAIIGPEGTDVSALLSGGKPAAKTEAKNQPEGKSEEKEEEPASTEKDSPTSNDRIAVSPLARKMAEDKGIDLQELKGSGENGRIVKKDIENYEPSQQQAQAAASKPEQKAAKPATPTFKGIAQADDTETPNSQVRNVIAKRLSESKFTAPHYYLVVEINMDKAKSLREEINALPDTKISYNDMVIKATALALRKHPQVNSSWAGDKIVHHGNIHVGVAVAIPDGLVVPVLKNTDYMSFTQISAGVKDMAKRAKEKGLKANEMEGSTFSVSNLGMYGIEFFTSIINQPNSAILSVGAIVEKPIVKEGKVKVGNMMTVSMACDHRVVDGATGAEFLQTLKTYLENPMTMLV